MFLSEFCVQIIALPPSIIKCQLEVFKQNHCLKCYLIKKLYQTVYFQVKMKVWITWWLISLSWSGGDWLQVCGIYVNSSIVNVGALVKISFIQVQLESITWSLKYLLPCYTITLLSPSQLMSLLRVHKSLVGGSPYGTCCHCRCICGLYWTFIAPHALVF